MIKRLAITFAEEFHQLHRTLVGKRDLEPTTAVQFTAAQLGEGVTSLTLAFAAAIAASHKRFSVIAVEANLRKPSFSDVLNIVPEKSLLDIVSNGDELQRAIQKIDQYGFSVICAGDASVKEGQEGIIESTLDGLSQAIGELKKMYSHVLVDSPPVIPYFDAGVIAAAVDSVVLVVESEKTRSEVLDRAIEKLNMVEANISGVILNKRALRIPKWIYRFF